MQALANALHRSRSAPLIGAIHGDLLEALLARMDLADVPALMLLHPDLTEQLRRHPLRPVLPLLARRVMTDPWTDLVWWAVMRSDAGLLRWLTDQRARYSFHSEVTPLTLAIARGDEACRALLQQLGCCRPRASDHARMSRVECLPRSTGVVVECGLGSSKELGLGVPTLVLRDAQLYLLLETLVPLTPAVRLQRPVTRVSCGPAHIAAIADELLWLAGPGPGSMPGAGEGANPHTWTFVSARLGRVVDAVATYPSNTYALTARGHIWGWGEEEGDNGRLVGLNAVARTPKLLTEVCAPGVNGYSLVPAPVFKGLGAAEDLLCAVSRDGALYAAGTCINLAWDHTEWDTTSFALDLFPVPTPLPVRSLLVTRDMPYEVGDGILCFETGGARWCPDMHKMHDPTSPPDVAAGGVLALLQDGSVFAALQQARVPKLSGVRAMAECSGRVAFELTNGQLVRV